MMAAVGQLNKEVHELTLIVMESPRSMAVSFCQFHFDYNNFIDRNANFTWQCYCFYLVLIM